jgi:predicted nucleotidyltransferase
MVNIFIPEHIEILKALNEYEVQYLLIGGYAVIVHGYDRTTGDMDIWLKPDNTNKLKLIEAFQSLGYDHDTLVDLSSSDFNETVMFFLGAEPFKVDFTNKIALVSFDEAYQNKLLQMMEEDFSIPVININELVLSKINTGRLKDQADIEELQKIQEHKKQ